MMMALPTLAPPAMHAYTPLVLGPSPPGAWAGCMPSQQATTQLYTLGETYQVLGPTLPSAAPTSPCMQASATAASMQSHADAPGPTSSSPGLASPPPLWALHRPRSRSMSGLAMTELVGLSLPSARQSESFLRRNPSQPPPPLAGEGSVPQLPSLDTPSASNALFSPMREDGLPVLNVPSGASGAAAALSLPPPPENGGLAAEASRRHVHPNVSKRREQQQQQLQQSRQFSSFMSIGRSPAQHSDSNSSSQSAAAAAAVAAYAKQHKALLRQQQQEQAQQQTRLQQRRSAAAEVLSLPAIAHTSPEAPVRRMSYSQSGNDRGGGGSGPGSLPQRAQPSSGPFLLAAAPAANARRAHAAVDASCGGGEGDRSPFQLPTVAEQPTAMRLVGGAGNGSGARRQPPAAKVSSSSCQRAAVEETVLPAAVGAPDQPQAMSDGFFAISCLDMLEQALQQQQQLPSPQPVSPGPPVEPQLSPPCPPAQPQQQQHHHTAPLPEAGDLRQYMRQDSAYSTGSAPGPTQASCGPGHGAAAADATAPGPRAERWDGAGPVEEGSHASYDRQGDEEEEEVEQDEKKEPWAPSEALLLWLESVVAEMERKGRL